MEYAKILHEVILPALLEHEEFKKVLGEAIMEIPITELKTIVEPVQLPNNQLPNSQKGEIQ